MLDRFGERLEKALDSVETTAGRRRIGSVALGVTLAVGVVTFGIAAFIIVFTVLVELIP